MERYDRLTNLIDRFKLAVAPAAPRDANLIVFTAPDGMPDRVRFRVRGAGFEAGDGQVLFCARVDWGGSNNPLLTALPDEVDIDLSGDPDSVGIARMMQSEITGRRCGADTVLSRLGEVLIVRMMRAEIEAGSTQPGLLAGLSDPRLSRAIVAMHDRPGQAWRNEDLAHVAGMSLSRFAETFLTEVGEPPGAYLRRWRLTLARQDIVKGHKVDAGFDRCYVTLGKLARELAVSRHSLARQVGKLPLSPAFDPSAAKTRIYRRLELEAAIQPLKLKPPKPHARRRSAVERAV